MFIRPWLEALKSRCMPGNRLNKRRVADHKHVQMQVESLEEKAMLSAFDLVTVIPNQGVFLSDGAKVTEAPTEVTLRFSPGQTITPASLGSITVVRAGLDGLFDDPTTPALESTDDVNVPTGFIGIGDQPNEVVVRFAQTLADDKYQIRIKTTGTGALSTMTGDTLNGDVVGGVTKPIKTFNMELDLGSQVTAVVPQPVIRSSVFTVANSSTLVNGDVLTVTNGPYTSILEFNTSAANVKPGHIFVNRTGGDSAVAQAINNAINGIGSPANVALTASVSQQTVTITGAAFEPTVTFGNPVLNVASASTLADGDRLLLTLGSTTLAFEFNDTVANNVVTPGYTQIDFARTNVTQTSINAAIVAAINSTTNNPTQTIKATLVGDSIVITGTTGTPAVIVKSQVAATFAQDFTSAGLAKALLEIPSAANLNDADTLTVSLGTTTLVFEFNNTEANNQVAPGRIRINYAKSTVTATQLATAIATAINNLTNNPTQSIVATRVGTSVALVGITGTPAVSWATTAAVPVFSQNYGTLTQATNKVVVYFNQDQLNTAVAQDPSYYRLINTTTNAVQLPSSVTYQYNPITGLSAAVLTFPASFSMANASYNLKVGVSSEPNAAVANAIQVGTVFNSQPYSVNEYLGDGNGTTSNDASDVDLYQFYLNGPGLVTLTATSQAGAVVTLLDKDGNVLAGPSASITSFAATQASGQPYFARISGTGSTGGYNLSISTNLINIDNANPFSDNNSSFLTATVLGTLGQGAQTILSQIEAQTGILMPPLPGGPEEPGHRDLPTGPFFQSAEPGHGTAPGSTPTAPGAIPVITFNFPDQYGTVLGQPVFNQITAEQKALARQIFEIYAYYAGVQFREVTSTVNGAANMAIVTGDIRAVSPTLDPNAAGGIANGSLAIINGAQSGNDSTYGSGWMVTAFHEIGHNLGLGHSYDVPSIQGPGVDGENVFPGDNDLVHLLRNFRNNSSDIDMYRFNVTQTGTLSAQTLAERLGVPSNLNTELTLYQESATGVRTIVARNDDFYSNDSGLNIELTPGTYYIGVTSTGNDNYDPTISDSGNGGTTDGAYQLKLNFTPKQLPTSGLRDLTGQALDGDHDGQQGGEYNAWFNVAPTATKIVDKLAPAGGDGSLAKPYNTISAGLAAAAGTNGIVRIVGNGGADRNDSTLGDNVPYAIGTDYNLAQTPLADGATFQVPAGVTVMIDAGTLIKLHGATIDVGTASPGNNRANGALQVLGTPVNDVNLTSWRDDSRGSIDDGVNGNASGADWGGIVFRQDSDSANASVFLNTVNHATIQYGGGSVSVDGSQSRIYNAIELDTARPTITNNTLINNADAAISASPNSFKADDGRIGPDIHGNFLANNSTNGLFIGIQTALGQSTQTLDVIARFDDTDITHVITQNLIINGQPGGTVAATSGSAQTARLSGRLQIDPGIIVKLSGSRIETALGNSNLIAEGTAENPIHFTSQQDDRYGAGGSFDLKNDGSTPPTPGNWGGFFMWPTSTASFDHITVNYAGGTSEVAGNSASFNPVEIVQADVRIANSVFENNLGGGTGSDRDGRGASDTSVIFVRGAQPQIIDNVFRDNTGNVISINANSLQAVVMPDMGRSTGPIDRHSEFDDNYGPLVRLNTYERNSTNGMNIRAEELTTESVWDDTDIAHVVRGTITSSEFHTYGGLRLQSSATGSLVVKLLGGSAGFLATGDPLEIDDRIGGTVQVIGQPGFPVILTSLRDDTVSTGFRPNGLPLFDTNNDGSASVAAPGDWNSLKFDQYSNDRNVSPVLETEPSLSHGNDINGTVGNPQFLGNLAPNQNSGDENRRLGFSVDGFISPDTPGDVDVYSFTANPGTEVWIDIDRTSYALDAMVELLDSSGNVIARSLNSGAESANDAATNAWLATTASDIVGANRPAGTVGNSNLNTLTKDPNLGGTGLGGDFYTSNFYDPGFRLVLPQNGSASASTYFVRVRSQPVAGKETDPAFVTKGLTSGTYQLQVRLGQLDEQAGSTVRYADVRFATNGIELQGLPAHSPLMGESSEQTGDNTNPDGAQNMGPLLQTDRSTISVSGNLDLTNADVDFFTFTLDYKQVQVIGGASDGLKFFPTMFDIDWADGLTRPDTIIAVYNSNRDLIYIGRDSDASDDQPAPGQGQDLDDLSRGSLGRLDPSIGTINLPAGVDGSSETSGQDPNPTNFVPRVYYVAVFSNGSLPTALTANFNGAAAPGTQQVRLEPINSIRRIVEDHVGFQGYTSNSLIGGTHIAPTQGPLFNDITSAVALSTNVKPFTLEDVQLYVGTSGQVVSIDPFNGQFNYTVSTGGQHNGLSDLDMREDGVLYGYKDQFTGGANEGILYQIDTGLGIAGSAPNNVGDAIPAFDANTNPPDPQQNSSFDVDAVAWRRNSDADPQYDEDNSLFYSVQSFQTPGVSKLYQARPDGNASRADNTPFGLRGNITGVGVTGFTTGMQFLNGQLFGVSSDGQFYRISTFNAQATLISDLSADVPEGFTALANPPKNVEGGRYANMLFALTANGDLVAIDVTTGQLQTLFDSNFDGVADADRASTGMFGAEGLAFSPIDFNLWHPTEWKGEDAGHGIETAPDNSRTPDLEPVAIPGRLLNDEGAGGASFYYGLEEWNDSPVSNQRYLTYGSNAQLGNATTGFSTQRDLTTGALGAVIGDNYNVPGGAYGSLVTNSFSLDGYTNSDKPTLYFNYWLDTQNANDKDSGRMRDSARVFVSADNGLTWSLVATNNSVLSDPLIPDGELPAYLSTSAGASTRPNQVVQELFDTAGWRQARVDLGQFAGQANLLMRFDFSTSGVNSNPNSADYQFLTGDDNGSFFSGNGTVDNGAQNNNHVGFFVDDIIVGFASRGEMVTASAGQGSTTTNLLANPFGARLTANPDPAGVSQLLTGAYQLEIRRGEDYAIQLDPAVSLTAVNPSQMLDVDDRQTEGQTVMVGNSIQDGDTVTVYDGLITRTFEFKTSGPASGTNIRVNIAGINPNTQKGQIANALATAITAAFAGRNTVIAKAVGPTFNSDRVDIFKAITVTSQAAPVITTGTPEFETNDTIATANATGINSSTKGTNTFSGVVGNGTNGTKDVDFWSVQLAGNQSLAIDLDIPSGVGNSVIQIFDVLGNLLASSDDRTGPNPEFNNFESFLIFMAPSLGTYYVGISAFGNTNYIPTVSGSGTAAAPAFAYDLNLTIVTGSEDESSPATYGNDVPFSFYSTVVPGLSDGNGGSYGVTGTLGNAQRGPGILDVDFYEMNLVAGQTVTVNLATTSGSSNVNYNLVIVRDGFISTTASVRNGTLTFTALVDDIYHIGVFGDDGSSGTPAIDPNFNSFANSLSNPVNTSTFDYYLAVNVSGGTTSNGPVPMTVDTYNRQGDDNLTRTQGQFIVENNSIISSSQNGIFINDNDRIGVVPHPGAPLNTPVQNAQRLVTGLYIQNNVIARSGTSGINLTGDPNLNLGPAIVPFVKIVNNTIYGGDQQNPGAGTGILVRNNASPTLMNNVIVNTNTAISVDATSTTTVVEANLYQGNTANGALGVNSLVVPNNLQLFVDTTHNNFYPAFLGVNSPNPLVDSSRSVFNDRAAYTAVTSPLGIPQSPIVAPLTDRYGQARVDDSNQSGPANQPGLGSNPFQDRGALERADFTGGVVIPAAPQDNDGAGVDLDPSANTIWVDAANPAGAFNIFTQFKLQLIDLGIGIDDLTVSAADFVLTKNGTPLVEGTDYFFTYNQNTNEAIFTSVSTFELDSRYQISVLADGITDLAGNILQNNHATSNGTSLLYFDYIITDGKNDAPVTSLNGVPLPATAAPVTINEDSSVTFSAANGNAITVNDKDAFLAPDGDPNGGTESGRIRVTVSVPNGFGTFTLATGSDANLIANGGSVSSIGVAASGFILEGRIDDINTALDGMKFTPTPDFPIGLPAATVNLTVLTEDLGKFGPPAPGNVDPQSSTSILPIVINPVNDAPTITVTTASPITIVEDAAGPTQINLTNITAGGGEKQSLRVTATSNNPALIPNANIIVGYPNLALPAVQPTTGNVQFTALPDQFGTAIITITVTDAGLDGVFGLNPGTGTNDDSTTTRNVTVNVTPVNDAPTINQPADATIKEDAGQQSLNLGIITVGPTNEEQAPESQTFTVTPINVVTTGNVTPLINFGTIVQNPDGTWSLPYTPVANGNGTVTFQLRVTDSGANGGANNDVNSVTTLPITIKITPVNDAPTVNVPANLTIREDDASNPQHLTLTGISGGPLEGTQTVTTVSVTSDNQSVIPNANIVQGVLTAGNLPLTITPLPNQFGIVTITVTITDDGPNSAANGDVNVVTKTFTITILPVNDAPSFAVVPPQTVLEDAPQQTITLSNISAGPANESTQVLTLSAAETTATPLLVPGSILVGPIVGGTATIRYTPIPNANGTATIRVTLKDNGGTTNNGSDTYFQDIVINLTAVNDAPTLNPIADQPVSGLLLEDAGQQTVNLSGITAGPANESTQNLTITAVITSGNPNLVNNFVASTVAANGTATLKYTPVPNEFGTATVTVTVTDNGVNGGANGDVNVTTQTFTITITPVNDAPTIDVIANQTVNEDTGVHSINLTGISVGQPNEAPPQTLTATITSDNPALIPNGSFTFKHVNGSPTGTLEYTPALNGFGVVNVTLTLKDTGGTANNGSDSITRTFRITVNQVGDKPSSIALSGNSVFENRPADTVIGNLSTSDVDLPDDQFTYSIVGGTDTTAFKIVGNQLQTSRPLDFESVSSYTVVVRTTDRFNLFLDQTFTVSVLDLNDAPTLNPINNVVFNEDPANPFVINLSGISAGNGELLQGLTVTATSDNPNLFNNPLPISYSSPNGTGTLTLNPRLNANGTATITVTVQDNGGTADGGIDIITRTFTVTVNPVNDSPSNISLTNDTIPEIVAGTPLPANVLVGQLSSTDPDNPIAGDTFSYSLVGGNGAADNAKFKIVGDQLFAVGPIDFDTQPDYTVRIRSTDNGTPSMFFEKVFTIHSTNVNEPASGVTTGPNPVSGIPTSIPENQPAGAIVGLLIATDPDAGDVNTFALVDGPVPNDNAKFEIVNGNLVAKQSFDFETQSSYTLRIRTVDLQGLVFEGPVTINVTNVDEAPTGVNLSNDTVAENVAVGASVGTLSTVDVDHPELFTYSLVAGSGSTDNARFIINGDQLIVATPLNYEERLNHSYSVRVRATDIGGLTFETVFTIHVTDVNEAPTNLTLSSSTIDENKPVGTLVGTLTPADQDVSDAYTYQLVSGVGSDDNSKFTLSGNKVLSAVSFDFETKSTYTIRVLATDSAGHQIERQFTIGINDTKDAPVITLADPTLTTTGKKVVVVDPAATITDIDSPNFDGGKLVVIIQSGEQTGDTLSIAKEKGKDPMKLKLTHGKTVLMQGKTTIATVSGGVRGIPLTIQFASGISKDLFQRVMRSITFRGKPFAAPRVIAMQAFDETKLGSNIETRNINVN